MLRSNRPSPSPGIVRIPSDYLGSRTCRIHDFCELTKGSFTSWTLRKLCESGAEIRPEVITRFSGVSNSSYLQRDGQTVKFPPEKSRIRDAFDRMSGCVQRQQVCGFSLTSRRCPTLNGEGRRRVPLYKQASLARHFDPKPLEADVEASLPC